MGARKEITDKEASTFPPKMIVCVGAVVLQEQRVLLVRQAKGHALAGQWSIPWGFVDEGETPEDAAVRETLEEGGVTAAVDGLLGIQNLPTPGWLGIIFVCRAVAGDPVFDGVETDGAAYFSLHEILALTEPVEPWCEWLALRVLRGEFRLISEETETPYAPRKAFV